MFKYFKNKSKTHQFTYYLLTGLGMVIFWRGIWGLLDFYLFPGNRELSYAISAVAGLLILFINDYSLSEMG